MVSNNSPIAFIHSIANHDGNHRFAEHLASLTLTGQLSTPFQLKAFALFHPLSNSEGDYKPMIKKRIIRSPGC